MHAAQIVDRGAKERVGGGLKFLMQEKYVQVEAACEPFDEPEQRRNDSFAARSIDAAGGDQSHAHARSVRSAGASGV